MQYKHMTMDRQAHFGSVVASREEGKIRRLQRGSKGVSGLFAMFY